jgi:hypothetical protein
MSCTERGIPIPDTVFRFYRKESPMNPTHTVTLTEAETGRLITKVIGTGRILWKSF